MAKIMKISTPTSTNQHPEVSLDLDGYAIVEQLKETPALQDEILSKKHPNPSTNNKHFRAESPQGFPIPINKDVTTKPGTKRVHQRANTSSTVLKVNGNKKSTNDEEPSNIKEPINVALEENFHAVINSRAEFEKKTYSKMYSFINQCPSVIKEQIHSHEYSSKIHEHEQSSNLNTNILHHDLTDGDL
ncbi:hypothetical protein CROQUDRAFT_111711 [Cronartium quercuum f. sp. fusiforme G11]|uniref:Uncharacterized protein n=1 Tax=Cronartium quercuum f. sp. fusiforme G11 TaxID=708437 RepID=A0A9P6T532_9BASI|nr:hypothetical protein CROQUDRAFT_111711 [Cronartium quercuum f. sp. fusiforme G11]